MKMNLSVLHSWIRSALNTLMIALLVGWSLSSQANAFDALAVGNAPDGSGSWAQSVYKNSYGQRTYYVYLPKQVSAGKPLPLFVMLHGCTQGAADFAKATRMNELADQRGFVVLYPEEDSASNTLRCWNWFSPENTVRGGGELGIITGMVGDVAKNVRIDPTRIFAAGFSAGAGLVSNLMACHSDLFAAGAIHSGLEYKAATSMGDAWPAMSVGPSHDVNSTAVDAARCVGASSKIRTLVVFNGKSDTTVNPKNSDRIVQQFTLVNDLVDDGSQNGSQNLNVIYSERGQVSGGYGYDITGYGGGTAEHIRRYSIDGMAHAWSGGPQGASFTDPKGPNASQIIVDLFLGK